MKSKSFFLGNRWHPREYASDVEIVTKNTISLLANSTVSGKFEKRAERTGGQGYQTGLGLICLQLSLLGERQAENYLPGISMGERGSCRAWLWFGRSLSLPVQWKLPLALRKAQH